MPDVAEPALQDSPPASSGRGCLLWVGLLLAAPAAALLLGWLSVGLSGYSAALGAGLGLLALGGLARAFGASAATRLLGAGAALVLAPWILRSVTVKGSDRVRLSVLPDDGGPRLLSKL